MYMRKEHALVGKQRGIMRCVISRSIEYVESGSDRACKVWKRIKAS